MTDEEVIKLFRGISESMQVALIEIMKVTQVEKEDGAQIIHRNHDNSICNILRDNDNAVHSIISDRDDSKGN